MLGHGADELPPNSGDVVFVGLSADTRRDLPQVLAHRFESRIGTARLAFRDAPSDVTRHDAVRISAPLVGPGYLNENGGTGRCDHTRAVLVIDGTRWLAQRFIIDWIRIDDQKRPHLGDWRVNENWLCFGDPVVSASHGRVVETLNTMDDNTPPGSASNLTPYTALGNHVIVDTGDDHFVVYAHLRPRTVAVPVGSGCGPGSCWDGWATGAAP